jgi:DNA-binding PadR family transcriptional regulator
MQEPSWLILSALDPIHALAGIEIIRKVEGFYQNAGYPHRHLDPSTLHYALRRMEEDGLVRCEGQQETEVPGPWGTTRLAPRAVYVITGLGSEALSRRAQLQKAALGRRLQVPQFGSV